MSAVSIAGETWERPLAAATLGALGSSADEILVPPELAGLAGAVGGPPVRVVGEEPRRFRPFDEIAADLAERRPDAPIVAAGATASSGPHAAPVHEVPSPRRHRRSRVGELDVWTLDTGDGYFAALTRSPVTGPSRPVWRAYGPGRPVFTRNTNDFGEPAPSAHDDYVVLGSGLLGWRMVLESEPPPGARVLVYDISPDQLAWSRHVVAAAAPHRDLAGLERSFLTAHPGAARRGVLPHEHANAELQAQWYAAHHRQLASLARHVRTEHLEIDLLSAPARLLDRLRPDRSVFFMYLDLFTVWHVDDDPPWIVELPGLARSLEREVRRRSAAATFLPGPRSSTLQLGGSPFTRSSTGAIACT